MENSICVVITKIIFLTIIIIGIFVDYKEEK